MPTQVQWGPQQSRLDPSVPVTISLDLYFNLNNESIDGSPITVAYGNCQVLSEHENDETLTVQVKLKVRGDKIKAWIEFVHAEQGRRVFDLNDLAPPIMVGQLCVVDIPALEQKYHLRFSDPKQTNQFREAICNLQITVADRRAQLQTESQENKDAAKSVDVDSGKKPMGATTEDVQPSDAAEVSLLDLVDPSMDDMIKNNDRYGLNGLDGLEGFSSVTAASFATIAGYIKNLLVGVLSNMSFDDEPIEPMIKGIETSLLMFWIEIGYLQGPNDPVKANILTILQEIAALKINLAERFRKELKKSNAVDESLEEPKGVETGQNDIKMSSYADKGMPCGTASGIDQRLKYPLQDILALRQNAVLPKQLHRVESLTNASSDLAKQNVKVLENVVRSASLRHSGKVDENLDTNMSNAECMLSMIIYVFLLLM